jgi:hypothetical protein
LKSVKWQTRGEFHQYPKPATPKVWACSTVHNSFFYESRNFLFAALFLKIDHMPFLKSRFRKILNMLIIFSLSNVWKWTIL